MVLSRMYFAEGTWGHPENHDEGKHAAVWRECGTGLERVTEVVDWTLLRMLRYAMRLGCVSRKTFPNKKLQSEEIIHENAGL